MDIHNTHIGTVNRWTKLIFSKCHIWSLVDYDKVVFVDADVIVHKPEKFMSLFETFKNTATPAATLMGHIIEHNKLVRFTGREQQDKGIEHSRLSGGLIVATPNQVVFDRIVKALKKPSLHANKFFTNHEEVFLGAFFTEWRSVHVCYQFAPIWLSTYKEEKHLLVSFTFKDLIATHFVGYKPHLYIKTPEFITQDKDRFHRRNNRNGSNIFNKSVDKWIRLAHKVERRIKRKGGENLFRNR